MENSEMLAVALRKLAMEAEGELDGENEYGMFIKTNGAITGPGGRELYVTAIWIKWHIDNSVHFVTLKPWRRER